MSLSLRSLWLLIGLGAAAADAIVGADAIVAWYDASGVYPQCSQGPKRYMLDCEVPSDLFAYIPAVKPTWAPEGVTCASMGFEYIGPERVFTGFEPYWRGGPPAWQAYLREFNPGHPDSEMYLNNTRDRNPACKLSGRTRSAAKRQVEHSSSRGVVAYHDATGTFAGCYEGEHARMRDCVMPSNYFAYMLSAAPVLDVQNCTALGFEYVEVDFLWQVQLFWKGGAAAASAYWSSFTASHPDMEAFLNKSRDENPAC